MPRVKPNTKGRDPIYTQARWGPKLAAPESLTVRTGGRIKKAKTIFDPSERYSKPQQETGKRRLSNTSQGSSTTTSSSAKQFNPPPPASPVAQKRRRTDSTAARKAASPPPEAKPVENKIPPSPPIKLKRRASPLNTSQSKSAAEKPKTQNSDLLRAKSCHKCRFPIQVGAGHPYVKCNGCPAMAHKPCVIHWTLNLGPWLCNQCHVCFECESEFDGEDSLTCSKCYISLHRGCADPTDYPVDEDAELTWECKHCVASKDMKTESGDDNEEEKENNEEDEKESVDLFKEDEEEGEGEKEDEEEEQDGESINDKEEEEEEYLPKDPKGPKSRSNRRREFGRRKKPESTKGKRKVGIKQMVKSLVMDDDVPDASRWTAKQVHEFFLEDFPMEAQTFFDQEIDGVSLLLMRRTDVIKGLGLKLGPALRIFKRIVMLQTRDTDPTLTWY